MRYISCLFLLLHAASAFGQTPEFPTDRLPGYWEGAFISGNAHQRIEVSINEVEGNWMSLQIMEEWHPAFGEFEIPLTISDDGRLIMNTGLGKTVLQLDPQNLEMLGPLEDSDPPMYLHLKKAPAPPAPAYRVTAVRIPGEGVELGGHLHEPIRNPTKTAVIIVGGRGCGAGATAYDLYAKFFRKYGVAALAYNKRGSGRSTGDCEAATITDLARDLVSVRDFLADHPRGFEKIGVLGQSAGAWVMARAEEMTDFDFMVSVAGPATSVKEQQELALKNGIKFYELSDSAAAQLRTYQDLLLNGKPTAKTFKKMTALLEVAPKTGWDKLLEGNDIPADAEAIASLWVRRHTYDPAEVLKNYARPYLAFLGDRDWMVPSATNRERLKGFFSGERSKLLQIVVAYDGEHGMEMQARYVSLADGEKYWHFYRISPQVRIALVEFLRKYDLAK
ncbi:MAG: alpha/beta hydrolase [Bacteroidota bacterium]